MLPESSPPAPGAPPRAKYRIRFRKAGDLRLVSHHDLMHCCERMFRRAALPVPTTQGFNPRPRMWFAQSLALGIAGLREVLELELTEPIPADELHQRLAAQAPPGLDILDVRHIDPKAGAQVRLARYRLPTASGGREPAEDSAQPQSSAGSRPPLAVDLCSELASRCDAFLREPHCWIERTRPQPRRLDIRPYVTELTVATDALEMALWITPHGAARPDEVAEALGLKPLLDAGAILERTDLELSDEAPPGAAQPPEELMRHPAAEPLKEKAEDRTRAHEPKGSKEPSPLIAGPMSFDS